MSRIFVEPELLTWAIERSRKPYETMHKRFPRLASWLAGGLQPTQRQLEDFARTTATPLGYFFLSEPPKEQVPIPDFRTLPDTAIHSPSADLLDTIYAMQRRQQWLRETLVDEGAEPLGFVGTTNLNANTVAVAHEMRKAVGFDGSWAVDVATWKEAVGELRRAIQHIGVMAVVNGVVANNTHRKLDVYEFRGFALCDEYAPLVFVNGADAKSAQMFTLVHEFAHIWLGRGGVSGFDGLFPQGGAVEQFCDKVAAEFLAPAREVHACWEEVAASESPFNAMARRFKVSPIVASRRALDLGLIDRGTFFAFYEEYCAQELHNQATRRSGGDFFNNQNTRVGERFAMEVFRAAKEGRLLYQEAYRLTDLNGGTFSKYAQHLGFQV